MKKIITILLAAIALNAHSQSFQPKAGQTLNSYYKPHIVNIIDTILSWQLQCKHLVYIILY